jgi:hypothetical protein
MHLLMGKNNKEIERKKNEDFFILVEIKKK